MEYHSMTHTMSKESGLGIGGRQGQTGRSMSEDLRRCWEERNQLGSQKTMLQEKDAPLATWTIGSGT